MKYFLLLFIPILLSLQTSKYNLLGEKDPILGDWEWVKDPTGSPYAPVPDIDWNYIHFASEKNQSFGAVTYDQEKKGYGCACYFLAYSNGTTMTGTIMDCCEAADKNKKINFNYQYSAADDQLIISVKDETYIYQRKK